MTSKLPFRSSISIKENEHHKEARVEGVSIRGLLSHLTLSTYCIHAMLLQVGVQVSCYTHNLEIYLKFLVDPQILVSKQSEFSSE